MVDYLHIPTVQDLGGVYLLDTRHMGNEGTVGVFLLPLAEGFCLIETGPGSTLPTIKQGISEAGFKLQDLQAILLTHIHLDHAGAAGALAAETGAAVYVHSSGYKHLADPSRLMASAERIYGTEMERLWGTMSATPEVQLRVLQGGERLELGSRSVQVLYTPGHASHHVAYLLDEGSLFTGDAAGIRMVGSSVIRPALPPPEVDLEAWRQSIQMLLEARPRRLLLTHFGEVLDAEAHLWAVPMRNQTWADEILRGLRAGETEADLVRRIAALGSKELEAEQTPAEVIQRHQQTSNYQMTVLGLTRYWQKTHPEALL
jgi:glyoxylase-like metal-dependent hydrolase (beta-lactamase superfamily II)